jgi:Na+/H+ antiporter NhaA
LMAVFFLLVSLEIQREFVTVQISSPRDAKRKLQGE